MAIVNLGAARASVSLDLYNEEGFYWHRSVELAPGEQLARFIAELFDHTSGPVPLYLRRGTLRVSSDQPVAAILIKTVDGLPLSVLPLGSREE